MHGVLERDKYGTLAVCPSESMQEERKMFERTDGQTKRERAYRVVLPIAGDESGA